MGNINFANGAFEDAVHAYANAIELLEDTTDKARLWTRLGETYQQLNKNDEADAAYKKAAEFDAENAAAHDNGARMEPASASVPANSIEENFAVAPDEKIEESIEVCDQAQPDLHGAAGQADPGPGESVDEVPFSEAPEPAVTIRDNSTGPAPDEETLIPLEQPVIEETVKEPETEAAYWFSKSRPPVRRNSGPVPETSRPSGGFRLSAESGVGNVNRHPLLCCPNIPARLASTSLFWQTCTLTLT